MNEVLLTLCLIWAVTFVISFAAKSAEASNAEKLRQRIEDHRRKRIDQLYGRD